MTYDIRKATSYVVLNKEGNILKEFATYDEAYQWVQGIERKADELVEKLLKEGAE